MRRIGFLLLAASLLASRVNGASRDWDFEKPDDRALAVSVFGQVRDGCSTQLGFTAVPARPASELQSKLQAYLLLRDDPRSTVDSWYGIIGPWKDFKKHVEESTPRIADLMRAAAADPDSYAEAEAKAVDIYLATLDPVMTACRSATRDGYLGKYFITGDGSVERYRQVIKDGFRSEVDKFGH